MNKYIPQFLNPIFKQANVAGVGNLSKWSTEDTVGAGAMFSKQMLVLRTQLAKAECTAKYSTTGRRYQCDVLH